MRTPDGWVVAPWTHLPMIAAPFADFTWRHARRLAAQAGLDDTNETDVARVLDQLLTRAQTGPTEDRSSARIAARTRVGAATRRPPPLPDHDEPNDDDGAGGSEVGSGVPVATFGIFDVDAEAERWT